MKTIGGRGALSGYSCSSNSTCSLLVCLCVGQWEQYVYYTVEKPELTKNDCYLLITIFVVRFFQWIFSKLESSSSDEVKILLLSALSKVIFKELQQCLNLVAVWSSQMTRMFTRQLHFGKMKRLVARRKDNGQPSQKLKLIGCLLSMSNCGVKLTIMNLPQLSIFLCFEYLWLLQKIKSDRKIQEAISQNDRT